MLMQLEQYIQNTAPRNEDRLLDNLAYTLGQRRSRFPWIVAMPAKTLHDLIDVLVRRDLKPVRATEVPRIGFVFTGQGAQWHAMGRQLIDAYPIFRATLLDGERHLKSLGAKWSLIGKWSVRQHFTVSAKLNSNYL